MTRIIIILFSFFIWIHSLSAQEFAMQNLVNDLESYKKLIEKKHANPFNWVKKVDFFKAIDDLKTESVKMNSDEFIVGWLKVNKLLQDEHTSLDFHLEQSYPIRFFWFEEGICATTCFFEDSLILGSRLISVNNIPLDSILNTLHKLIGLNTYSGYSASVVELLKSPNILHGLNITDEKKEVTYLFVNDKKDTIIKKMQPVGKAEKGYMELRPAKPLLRNSDFYSSYWFKFDEVNKFLYINYNRCSEMTTFPFSEFLKSVSQVIETKKPEKIIVDLRQNGGGSSRIFKPLIIKIAHSPETKDKKIFTLVGRRTFSAAVVNAFQLRTTAHSIIIGEESGGKLNHAGAVMTAELKKTKTTVYYSSYDFYFDSTQKGGVVPDVPIKIRLVDYINGIDPALDYAIEN